MTAATATAWVAGRLWEAEDFGPARSGPMRRDDPVRVERPARQDPVRPVGGRRLTLEQRLDSVWEGLRAGGVAECPLCRGRMEGFGPGRGRDCGSELR